jgi:hypothetical protein
MTKNRDLLAEALDDLNELVRIKELLKIISEECSKPKKDWNQERVILLVELYISRNNCHLEDLEIRIERAVAEIAKKPPKKQGMTIVPQKEVEAA